MNVLFVGNGINRFANIVPGWSELFSKAVNIDGFKMQKSLTPTMEYDLNTHLILDRDPTKKSTDIKRSIAAYLKGIQNGLPKNWADTIHKRLIHIQFIRLISIDNSCHFLLGNFSKIHLN